MNSQWFRGKNWDPLYLVGGLYLLFLLIFCGLVWGQLWNYIPFLLIFGVFIGDAFYPHRITGSFPEWKKIWFQGFIGSLIYTIPILILYTLAILFAIYQGWLSFKPAIPDHFGHYLIWQLGVIALPEELFFRGTLQRILDQKFGKPWKFLGTPWGKGLLITAFLFMIPHLILYHSFGLLVFFPGLLFGFLYSKYQTIIGSVLCHWLCNLCWIVLQGG